MTPDAKQRRTGAGAARVRELLALSLYHETVEPYASASGNRLQVRLRLGRDLAARVAVVHCDKFLPAKTTRTTAAQRYALDGSHHELFQAELTQRSKRFKYLFRIDGGRRSYFFSRSGLTDSMPPWEEAFEVPYLGERDGFNAPLWAAGAVYYQVFPDRFARFGDAPASHTLTDWNATPTPASYYGGNLAGIRARLDHLTSLGVNVLYMTPIFTAPSNHKYDTADYLSIDPDFGTEEELRLLVADCHTRGIRVVLDAVFNHMGDRNPVFLDLLQRGSESRYADWIYAESWPLSKSERNYETFGYVANMPKWRTANRQVEDFLTGVAQYWIEHTGIDGWRLDVSDEVEHTFWRRFRDQVKSVRPDALICGEIWQVATPWLRGDQFDTVMNYPFARAVLDWLGKGDIDAAEFDLRIEQIRAQYAEDSLPYLWNLLDSHDTPRLLSVCQMNRKQAALAVFVQFTAFGAPMIYYGDEVGMAGDADPLCRGGMLWEEQAQDRTALDRYRRLATLRQTHPALRHGAYRPLFRSVSPQLYGYLRQTRQRNFATEQETLFCVLNNADASISFTCSDAQLPEGLYKAVYGDPDETLVRRGDALTLREKSAILFIRVGD